MSRILVITPCPTHPATEGNARRVLNLVEALLRLGHDTHILYLPHFLFSLPDLPAMRRHWKERLHVARPHLAFLPGFLRNALLLRRERMLGRLRRAYDHLARPQWEFDALSLWERYRFDVVVIEYILISIILRQIPDTVLKIIDTHDIFADRNQRVPNVPKPQQWFSTTREGEALGLNRAHVVLAIQDEEAGHFRSLTSNPVVTVGHLLSSVKEVGEPVGPPSALFVASQNPINRHGLLLFLEQAWPLVRKELPDARLRLVGRIGDSIAGDWPGLERLGVIEDMTAAYERGHVVVNPVLEGTGLPIKSIEALERGKPLVTTAWGARGITDGAGAAFLVGEDPARLAASVVLLLRDAEARRRLAAAALRYALGWNERQARSLQRAVAMPAPARRSVQ
jgi:glycosyltransferase involved in cell wall biosynthesis